jgi:molecular chaperone Hsp33
MDRITAGFDQLTRFWLETAPARGVVARLDESITRALTDHEYPPVVQSMLRQMAGACVLLASNLKQRATIVMQAQGTGPVPLLCVEATDALTFRAYANVREGAEKTIAADALLSQLVDPGGKGRFVLTIDPDVGQMYQSIVSMEADSVATILEGYLSNSQQTDTRVWLREDGEAVEAAMLERLPERHEDMDVKAWAATAAQLDATFALPFMPFPYSEWLSMTFVGQDVRVHPAQAVKFACPCSMERVLNALKLVGKDELVPIIDETGQIQTQCEFCGARYEVDRGQLLALFSEANPKQAPSTRTLE